MNLLENFYTPQRGQILLDGTPLDAIDHEYLHSQISLVSQEPVLFAGDCKASCHLGFGMSSTVISEMSGSCKKVN